MHDETTTACISCGKVLVTWPLVCHDCIDHEAQAELAADPNIGPDFTCRTCGMIYDGGMRCTYCGDSDPTGNGDLDDEDDDWDDLIYRLD